MIKSILVCTDGSPHGDVACDYAIYLAGRLKGRLIGLHVLDVRMLEGPLMADISGWIGAQPYGAQVKQFRQLMEEKGDAISRAFDSRCREAGVMAESWVKTGHPVQMILAEETRAELLVLGQKGEHAGLIGDMPGSTLERIARQSVKPCLVTPAEFRPVSRILAAYDGSAHASRALQEAVELAQALGVSLVILTVAEADHHAPAEQLARDAEDLADAHGCSTKTLVVQGRSAAAILAAARGEGCDLIAMGAYGHSRIREMILGSTTTHVIARSQVPVLVVR